MRILLFCFFAILSQVVFCQAINQYEKLSGDDYWKDRKPNAAYWQQDVHYQIKVQIDDDEESISGSQKLKYFNNSPDTLSRIYFHLYQNAFTPNSYAHKLRQSGKLKTTFGEYETKGVGTEIYSLLVNGAAQSFYIDNTILIVDLEEPLLPGVSLEFDINFKTFWDRDDGGNMRRRMKSFEHDDVTHFDGVHWYPRICVYDSKFGWTTDQHLGKEFYGDFGLFEVELTFPSQYVVEATGELQNEEEVYPESLRDSLDLKYYANSKVAIKRNVTQAGGKKTWKFKAVNVHDFAFTADPSYRIGEVDWNGVKCVALAQEQHAHRWQPTAKFAAKVVETYSKEIGMYGYPKIVVADARDGMEYPMITLNSGNWPRHQYVIAHEVGHNWFFGMIGTNETYRASLDEGFTQYLTALSLKKIGNQDFDGNSIDKGVVFSRYLSHAANENTAVLSTHSDHFNSADRHGGGYGQVYFKTATMLYNLEYVLGKELFKHCMQKYFEKWKYAHPYYEDFKTSIMHSSGTDLNWFFDQWINTTKKIDYKVKKVISNKGAGSTVTLERKTTMQMPLDLEIQYEDNSKEKFHVPNTYFVKETDAMVLEKWTGWDEWNTTYSFETNSQKKIKNVVIDPSKRLADVYRLDNSKKTPINFQYSTYRKPFLDYEKYQMRWNPNIWYNSIDGIKIGFDVFGNYFGSKHKIDATVWYNSEIGADQNKESTSLLSYVAEYENRVGYLTDLSIESRLLDGLMFQKVGISKDYKKSNLNVYAKSLYRNTTRDLDYLIFPQFWRADKWNNSLNLEWIKRFRVEMGNSTLKVSTRSSYLLSDYNFAWLRAEINRNLAINKFDLRLRGFAQYGTGDFAPESQLMLSGANMEDMMDNPWVRSVGFVPNSLSIFSNTFNNFHHGGGLNLRGFSGYEAVSETDGDIYYIYTANSGASINAEFDFAKAIGFSNLGRRVRNNIYVFTDAGLLQNSVGGSSLRADAGVGYLMTYNFLKFNHIKPIRIRIDFPFFVNRIPQHESQYVDFRYIIGLNKAF